VIEEMESPTVLAVKKQRKRRLTSRDPRPASIGDGLLWHARMGHPGPMSLHMLGKNSLGVRLRGPKTVQCPYCSLAKIKRQISRRPPDRIATKPCEEIDIDWTDLKQAHEGFVRVMFIHDRFSGLTFSYFMSTHGQEKENLRILKDFVNWMEKHYHLEVKFIRADNEMKRKRTLSWMRSKGITFEPSAPRTQAQNGAAERSGGIIMEKARAMRISANLPHDLWKEIINAATYLYNRTPREAQEWKSPYEVFFSAIEGSMKRPKLAHLKAYGCRAYAMTEKAQDKKKRKWKLNPRAYIGYLVGYDSTNIFRIWIPSKGQVISTRDALFDEYKFFDGKPEHMTAQMANEMDSLIAKIQLPENEAINDGILEDDEIEDYLMDTDDPDDEPVAAFDDKEDFELAKALEEALSVTSPNPPTN
jgi:transposase InsO family protein